MYRIQFAYFDLKGNQKEKELSSNTERGLINKLDNFINNHSFYHLIGVSENLENNKYINNL